MSDVAVAPHTHSCGVSNEQWRGVVWCLTAVAVCAGGGRTTAGVSIAFGVLLGAAAAIDLMEFRLPNDLLLTAAVVALVAGLATHRLPAAVLGGVLCGLPMLGVRLLRGVGMGDVKAAAVVGVQLGVYGWVLPLAALAGGVGVAAVVGVVAHRQRLPLGPFLWIGWCAASIAAGRGW